MAPGTPLKITGARGRRRDGGHRFLISALQKSFVGEEPEQAVGQQELRPTVPPN